MLFFSLIVHDFTSMTIKRNFQNVFFVWSLNGRKGSLASGCSLLIQLLASLLPAAAIWLMATRECSFHATLSFPHMRRSNHYKANMATCGYTRVWSSIHHLNDFEFYLFERKRRKTHNQKCSNVVSHNSSQCFEIICLCFPFRYILWLNNSE